MANYAGCFVGYREWKKLGGRIQLELWELDGRIPSWMEVYAGTAGDTWSAMQTFIDSRTSKQEQTIMLLIMAYDNEAVFRVSVDGVVYSEIIEIDPNAKLGGSVFRRYSAKGFGVRNLRSGAAAKYQVIAMW